MQTLTSHEVMVLLLALGVLLVAARVLGELARWLNQPIVLGEILAGILLGPTVLGAFAPDAFRFLFPSSGGVAYFFDGITTLAIVLFLLVAGLEVELSTMWRQGKTAMSVGLAGIVLPFAVGFSAGRAFPDFLGSGPEADPLIFALFLGTALSITALPIIAKILMDLNIYRSDIGMVVVAAAVFNDLIGWLCFALVLSMMGASTHPNAFTLGETVFLTLGFTLAMLTVGRWLLHYWLPWIQAHTSWPGGVLGLSLALAVMAAAFTEWIGVHAIFGSFLVGVAIGDSAHLREQTRSTIHQFVSFIFAPIFFASIGLRVDFVANFDWLLTLIVLFIACFGKVVGCGIGARIGGMSSREAWATAFAMNARGAMEIILGLLAMQYGLIGERMFVSLVVMAIVTSIISGPAMKSVLRLERARRLSDYLGPKGFVNGLQGRSRDAVIRELVQALLGGTALDVQAVTAAVLAREALMPTGIGNRIAVPHARVRDLGAPLVALGLSPEGVDFDAPDGEPAQLVFLILTPQRDDGAQVLILADIARQFTQEDRRHQVLSVKNFTELLALLKTHGTAE